MPRVSAVIATYNTARYVGEAVESVLQQSMDDLELVVVDDGSTDDTPAVISKFKSDPRLRYVRQDNGGQASAKNRGIAESSAPLIGFCDADDAWHPRKLELQLPAFDRPEVGVVYSNAQRFVETPDGRRFVPRRIVPRETGKVTEALFVYNFVPFGTAMFRRSLVDRWGAFNESYRMGIDWDLWLRLSLHCEFAYVDEVVCLYRVWEQQMSSNWRGRYQHAAMIMESFLASNPGAVSSVVARRAWADTYARRGRARVTRDSEHARGLLDALLAVAQDPGYPFGWRTVGWVLRDALRSLLHLRARAA
jgi:glycosyltransferase involved in cell wall biosynthesis